MIVDIKSRWRLKSDPHQWVLERRRKNENRWDAVGYYRDAEGRQTTEVRNYRSLIRTVRDLYCDLPAADNVVDFALRLVRATRPGGSDWRLASITPPNS